MLVWLALLSTIAVVGLAIVVAAVAIDRLVRRKRHPPPEVPVTRESR